MFREMLNLGYQKNKKKTKTNRSRDYIGSLTPRIPYEWDKIDARRNVDLVLLSEALVIIYH